MKGQKLDSRSIELLDVWNEVGGQIIIHQMK